MSIFAISDLHLSFANNKPMDIFGGNWVGHVDKIKQDWEKQVRENDLVLLPGDFSWAMHLQETVEDFTFLNKLPGKKLLLKGNHDYWWTTLASMRKFLEENNFENIDFIYNNSYLFEDYIICGSRGWTVSEGEENEKIINREKIRLELSITDGIKRFGENKKKIVCMHYPPSEEFQEIIKKYNANIVIYGHLHGVTKKDVIEEIINEIEYKMVSCDYTNFKLIKII